MITSLSAGLSRQTSVQEMVRGGADSGGPTAPVNVAIPGDVQHVFSPHGGESVGSTSDVADVKHSMPHAVMSPSPLSLQPSQSGMIMSPLPASATSIDMVPDAIACVTDAIKNRLRNRTINMGDVRSMKLFYEKFRVLSMCL